MYNLLFTGNACCTCSRYKYSGIPIFRKLVRKIGEFETSGVKLTVMRDSTVILYTVLNVCSPRVNSRSRVFFLLHLSSSCLFVHLRVIFPCRQDDQSTVLCFHAYFSFHRQQGNRRPFFVVSF